MPDRGSRKNSRCSDSTARCSSPPRMTILRLSREAPGIPSGAHAIESSERLRLDILRLPDILSDKRNNGLVFLQPRLPRILPARIVLRQAISHYRSSAIHSLPRSRPYRQASRTGRTPRKCAEESVSHQHLVDTILTNVMFFLQAIERIELRDCGGLDTISVPSDSGRREFRMRTGMFFSIAGRTVAGCNTFAPK